MVRPILDKQVQPFRVFASVGAASGDDLYKLVLAAIIRLEAKGARVLVVVSDRASTNTKVWKLAGLGTTETSVKGTVIQNSMPHPTVDGKNIYMLQNPLHAF